MAKREILTYPNPILREVSKPVTVFDQKLKTLVEDMLETMYDANGIGLAAPQVGELIQVLVLDTRPKDEKSRRYEYDQMTACEQKIPQPLVLINPQVIKGEGKTTFDEGCLSVPTYFETVERSETITVKAFDATGKEFQFEADGLLAICIQHEMDHLTGTLFIDHLSFLKSNKIKNQIKKHGYRPKNDDDDDDEAPKRKDKEKVKEKVPTKS